MSVIVIVDDCEVNLKLLERVIAMVCSATVVFACSSVDGALDTVAKLELGGYKVDLIISDYHMPEKNGGDFLQALRSAGNKTPFVILTSDTTVDERCFMSVEKVIYKPVKKSVVAELLFKEYVCPCCGKCE